jgi:hypothetical protein
MNEKIITYLQESSLILNYLTKKDLLNLKSVDEQLIEAKKEAFKDPLIVNLIDELQEWPGSTLKRHNDAKLQMHKLSFLADLGMTIKDKGIKDITERILEHESCEGIFQVKVNIPVRFGGTGEDQYSWMLCDAPLLFYSLIKLGVDRNRLNQGLEYLFSLSTDYGFPCAASPELGRFNGPGKRGTICPYANLLMLKLFTLFPEKYEDIQCKTAVYALLDHWEKKDKKYLFGIGSDFNKLKFPFIWFDILHVAEILSYFDYAVKDKRFLEILSVIKVKRNSEQLFKAESVWMAWKNIDSGHKKTVSSWISFIVYRIFNRI